MAFSLHVVAEFESASGFTDESYMNTFSFVGEGDADAATLLDIKNAVAGFYNTTPSGESSPLATYISAHVSRAAGGVRLKVYDLGGLIINPPFGSPIDEDSFTLGATSSTESLPWQCAAVLTLRARNAITSPVESGTGTRPRQRLSGRLYLGPLAAEAADGTSSKTVGAAFRTLATKAAETMQDALVDGEYAWGVWSRAEHEIVPIVRVEMDDSIDVLRSRKKDPTVRTAVTFSPVPALILGA